MVTKEEQKNQRLFQAMKSLIISTYFENNAYLLNYCFNKSGFYVLIATISTPSDIRIYHLKNNEFEVSLSASVIIPRCIEEGLLISKFYQREKNKFIELFPMQVRALDKALKKVV